MAQTNYESTRTLPLLILSAAVVALAFFCACAYCETYFPRPDKDLVRWVDASQAVALAKKSGKPLLYEFSAAWCGPCQVLAKQVFGNRESASLINKSYIPVKVIDRQKEDTVNTMQVEALQKKYDLDGFPMLVVDKLDGTAIHRQVGYDGKEETDKFLQASLLKTPASYEYMLLKWLELDKAVKVSAERNKPLLVMFWNYDNEYSKSAYLGDKDLTKLIERNFVPSEVLMPAEDSCFKNREARDLFNRLAVKHAPAMVIVPRDGSAPHFQFGSARASDNRDFLTKYLESKGK